jgi:hypothetical protein
MSDFTQKLIDEVAKIIYHNDGGMTDRDYENLFDKPRRLFHQPPEVYVPPEFQYWLEEHERDEYRWQAKNVLGFLRDKKLLKDPPKPVKLSEVKPEELRGLPED